MDALRCLGVDAACLAKIEYLPGGYSNRNYMVVLGDQIAVLRVSQNPPRQPESEQAYFELANSPELLAYDADAGHMLTRWVDGTLLVHKQFNPNEASRYLNELHETIPVGISVHDPVLRSKQQFESSGTKNVLYDYLIDMNWEPRRICGCHNDLNPYNIIRAHDRFVTLDWEFAGDNEPLFDAVNLCYGLDFSDEEFEQCVSGLVDTEVDQEFLRSTRLLFQIREHSWALDQIARGNDREEIQRQARDCEAEFLRLLNL